MIDYTQMFDRIQRKVAETYTQSPEVLNVPGKSMACRIDPYYFLALHRGLMTQLAQWGVTQPFTVESMLIKTGVIITSVVVPTPVVPLTVSWPGGTSQVKACFIDASFFDKALSIYAGGTPPLPVSDLRIAASDRKKVQAFFTEKTPPQSMAYTG